MPPPTDHPLVEPPSAGCAPLDHWLDRIRHRADLCPESVALVCGNRSISYAALAANSDRIAGQIADSGIEADHYVGCGFHRSEDLITALLGIIKSGAAYVPLDPEYPAARIAHMIQSADLKTVLTTRELAPCFPGTQTLITDEGTSIGGKCGLPSSGPHHHQPVYAIFTSGSTGKPKAASVYHSGFSNLLEWYCNELAIGPDDRTLVISSPSFDLTQKNLFAPLITGGTLILDDGKTYDITRILRLIRDHGVTLINCTPSAFYPLVDAAAADGFSALTTLRYAVLGGESISIPRLRAWLEHPACTAEVVNSYGPTECTDICLFHRLHRGNLDTFPFVPLGREIPNVRVTIRDENLSILPDGETGELCIGGSGVGGGYLNDPLQSESRFINGIYRTGDLARRLPCGTFEFRGRADHQVKVNGFRIELGEIEIALNTHADVREAVVTATGDKLTAHIQGQASIAGLRAHLSACLPAYMIPAEFVFVDSFPLTPNGKVNRKALAEIQAPQSSSTPGDSSLESRILALWSDVLGHTVTDSTANFFDLGGNSIHLAVVHVRLREMTGRDFPITDLFSNTNARSIASHLAHQQVAQGNDAAQSRARLARAGFARFQRPLPR